MWFEVFSGLKINLNKSEIIPLGRVDNMEVLASELGCGVGSLPTTYLGLLTGLWGFGILLKKDLEKDCHPGKDNISQRVGGSPSFEVHCLASPFTSSLCLECQSLFVLDWRRFIETFSRVVAI